jgi:hypothetical protein
MHDKQDTTKDAAAAGFDSTDDVGPTVSATGAAVGKQREFGASRLMGLALVLETVLVVLALALATWFGFYDRENPLSATFSGAWYWKITAGVLFSLPLLAGMIWIESWPFGWVHDFRQLVQDVLTRVFREMGWPAVLVISLLARKYFFAGLFRADCFNMPTRFGP